MTFQTGANVLTAIRRETAINVQATATGAQQIRIINSPGLVRNRANIQSAEKRADMLKSMTRLGAVSITGSFNAELTVGGATDTLLEAMNRGTWATATSIPFASLTTVAIGTNTLTGASNDWIVTQGIRVGDIFTLSGTTVPGNNGTNARVVALGTLTITTTPGAFTTLVATATGTLTRLKKLINPAVPTRYSHSIEQVDKDITASELFTGCRLIGLKLSFKPGAMATAQYTFLGVDRNIPGAPPYFTAPTVTTGLDLIADDSLIRYNGAPIASFTGLDLQFDLTAKGEPVIGSFISPDVFDNDYAVKGTITALRQDLSNLTLFDAETEFELSMLLQEPNSGPPKSCLSFYLGRVKIGGISAPFGGDGAKTETLPILVGPKVASAGFDAGYVNIASSAP